MTHDFEKCLREMKGIENSQPKRDGICSFFHTNQEQIQLALRIADRLQKGEVSAKMLETVQKNTEIGSYVCANWSSAYECIEEIFKAMSQELIKEVENEASSE